MKQKQTVLLLSLVVAATLVFPGLKCDIDKPPRIISIVADPDELSPGDSATITATAQDEDGDSLTFTWTASAGFLSSSIGNPVSWLAPGATGTCTVSLVVADVHDEADSDLVAIQVVLPSIFELPDAVHSPDGYVPFGDSAHASDSARYAREILPKNEGNIGVFESVTDTMVCHIRALPAHSTNVLKGLAWSKCCRYLAVMYHAGMKPGIYLYDAADGHEVRQIADPPHYYHCMAFSRDNRWVCVSLDGRTVHDSFPSLIQFSSL